MHTYKLVKLILVTATLSSAMLASATAVSGAADVPPRAPAYRAPPPLPPYYLWTGFYVGAHAGAGWFDGGGDGTSGFIGGGQVGYNYQVNNWVFGLEADLSGTSIGGSENVGFASASWGLDWVSTFTPRLGYAFDRWLVYGKAGAAWAHASASASALGLGSVSVDQTTSGFVFGVGMEYALGNNWSAKVEYDVFDFSDSPVSNNNFQTLKGGVNYRFGGQGWPF